MPTDTSDELSDALLGGTAYALTIRPVEGTADLTICWNARWYQLRITEERGTVRVRAARDTTPIPECHILYDTALTPAQLADAQLRVDEEEATGRKRAGRPAGTTVEVWHTEWWPDAPLEPGNQVVRVRELVVPAELLALHHRHTTAGIARLVAQALDPADQEVTGAHVDALAAAYYRDDLRPLGIADVLIIGGRLFAHVGKVWAEGSLHPGGVLTGPTPLSALPRRGAFDVWAVDALPAPGDCLGCAGRATLRIVFDHWQTAQVCAVCATPYPVAP